MKECIKEWLLEVLKLSILYIAVGFVAGVYSVVYGLIELFWYPVPEYQYIILMVILAFLSMHVVWVSLEAKLNTLKLFKEK